MNERILVIPLAEVEITELFPVGVLTRSVHKPTREEEFGHDAVEGLRGVFAVPNDVVFGVRTSLRIVNVDVGAIIWIWYIGSCAAGHKRVVVVRAATPATSFCQHFSSKS